ncbi:hypothetical protein [Nocardia sp. GAS34]|uniref:hypothetical protein n=1 Tax=unclassified Nocardia TaxID=2637762 RepID=UPI003D1ADDEE
MTDSTTAPEQAQPRYTVSAAEARQMAAAQLEEARRLEDEQIAELPADSQQAIQEIQDELAARGAEVHAVTKWWGFEIHLNAEAAQIAAQITEQVGKILSNIPKLKPFSPLIKAFCKLKAAWIKAVGKDYGCKLVSPWIAPGMLIPIALAPKDDTSLWWTVFTDGNKWNEDQKFTDHYSKSNPALAVYKGRLYCAHRGNTNDASLWWTMYETTQADAAEPKSGWTPDTKFPAHYSSAGPALATFGDYLYCVHRGNGSDTELWWSRFNGTSWSTDTRMSGRTSDGPALAVFNNKLWCVYKGYNNNRLYSRTFDGTRWSGESEMAPQTDSNPALAVYKNHLYVVFKGKGTTMLWFTRNNGNGWESDRALGAHASQEGPGLAVFGDHLYCVHRGGSTARLWWTRYNGSSWSADTQFPGHYSEQGPALVTFRDPNGTEDQLLCVHRGS